MLYGVVEVLSVTSPYSASSDTTAIASFSNEFTSFPVVPRLATMGSSNGMVSRDAISDSWPSVLALGQTSFSRSIHRGKACSARRTGTAGMQTKSSLEIVAAHTLL